VARACGPARSGAGRDAMHGRGRGAHQSHRQAAAMRTWRAPSRAGFTPAPFWLAVSSVAAAAAAVAAAAVIGQQRALRSSSSASFWEAAAVLGRTPLSCVHASTISAAATNLDKISGLPVQQHQHVSAAERRERSQRPARHQQRHGPVHLFLRCGCVLGLGTDLWTADAMLEGGLTGTGRAPTSVGFAASQPPFAAGPRQREGRLAATTGLLQPRSTGSPARFSGCTIGMWAAAPTNTWPHNATASCGMV